MKVYIHPSIRPFVRPGLLTDIISNICLREERGGKGRKGGGDGRGGRMEEGGCVIYRGRMGNYFVYLKKQNNQTLLGKIRSLLTQVKVSIHPSICPSVHSSVRDYCLISSQHLLEEGRRRWAGGRRRRRRADRGRRRAGGRRQASTRFTRSLTPSLTHSLTHYLME